MNHKHKGLLNAKGKLRMHPIERTHKDSKVQKYHVMALKQEACDDKYGKPPKKDTKKKIKGLKNLFGDKKQPEEKVCYQKIGEKMPTDDDGYLAIDLRNIDEKGVRIIGAEKGKIWFAKKGDIKGIQFDK